MPAFPGDGDRGGDRADRARGAAGADADARCPRCGRTLRSSALDGLCPTCLMRQALAGETSADPLATGVALAGAASAADSSVQFTAALSSSSWTLVTLMADDEECVTYLARNRDDASAALAQLVVHKQHVPAAEVADARQELQRRRDALRRLSHPALAPVLDGGLTDDGHPFLVTAFVMATPLDDFDPEGTDPDRLRALVDRARAGLQALHDAGLAHGRVRASTVLARRAKGGATTVVTGYAPLDRFPALPAAIADDLEQLQRLTSTLRI
jgi:hypothetical protein